MNECTLNDPKWLQCCCNCENHHPDFSHPHVDGKPVDHQKGWACTVAATARHERGISSGWPEHSPGCSMYNASPAHLRAASPADQADPALGEFGYHEALDRTHVLLSTFSDHVVSHPVVAKNPRFKARAEKAEEIMVDLYQDLAREWDEKFPANNPLTERQRTGR